MSGLLALVSQPLKFLRQGFHGISALPLVSSLVQPEAVSLSSVRNKVRCHFPRPNEVRRVRRHGWDFRVSTPNGRKVIMRRLLKGRHVLTH